MPPAPRQKPKQKSAAGAPRQSLLGSMGWALGTGVGMIYLAAVLCLCAWPCVHFIVQLAQHTNMVSLTLSLLLPFRPLILQLAGMQDHLPALLLCTNKICAPIMLVGMPHAP